MVYYGYTPSTTTSVTKRNSSKKVTNRSEIPIMAFITNMTISYFLHKKQMNGMKDAWNEWDQ